MRARFRLQCGCRDAVFQLIVFSRVRVLGKRLVVQTLALVSDILIQHYRYSILNALLYDSRQKMAISTNYHFELFFRLMVHKSCRLTKKYHIDFYLQGLVHFWL